MHPQHNSEVVLILANNPYFRREIRKWMNKKLRENFEKNDEN
jgi:TusA-related sulfurtransferase